MFHITQLGNRGGYRDLCNMHPVLPANTGNKPAALLAWSLSHATIFTHVRVRSFYLPESKIFLVFFFKMVDLSDPKSHEKFSVDVKLLLVPGILLFMLVGKSK